MVPLVDLCYLRPQEIIVLIDVQKVRSPVLSRALGKVLLRELRNSRASERCRRLFVKEVIRHRTEIMPLLRAGREIKDAWPNSDISLRVDFDHEDTRWMRENIESHRYRPGSIFEMHLSHPNKLHRRSFLKKVREVAFEQNCNVAEVGAYADIVLRPRWGVG